MWMFFLRTKFISMDGLGRFMIFFGQQFTRMESFRTYVRRVVDESVIIGYNSVFLFAIIATFMGAVTTLQTAYNLVSPLVPIYIVSLVVRDMTLLELAPTIMAIVFAGKVGSNIAGELGTMRITEQIDALEVMGINATSYLVLPKIIAAVITYPMLVILSGFLTITGGYLISIVTGVLTGTEYIYGVRYEFVAFNVSFALIKAVTFGFLVAAISAYKGFYTQGGALEVGKSSTSAVNNSCIAILIADYVLAQLLIWGTMIEIVNIKKSFGGKPVLHGISGRFEQGKTNLIIGASGTGKSVLLKCMVGLVMPDEGNVLYDGRDFTHAGKDVKTDIRREIGMLFQGGALFDSMNVEQNVMFPLNVLTKMAPAEKIDRVNFCLERVGLAGVNKKMPSEVSGGMKKRVGIARAIVNNSRYLFCDEPNSGLDPQTSIKIDNLIQEITYEYNITTIVVTHDMNSVMEIGDYVLFMHQGQKVWEGSSETISKAEVAELRDFIFANKLMRSMVKEG